MKTNETKITEIEIIPVKPRGGLIGFASFVLDEKYYVSSVAIFTKINSPGFRLVYPSKKLGEKNLNIFHPITKEVGQAIEKAVTKKVNELFGDSFNENYKNGKKLH